MDYNNLSDLNTPFSKEYDRSSSLRKKNFFRFFENLVYADNLFIGLKTINNIHRLAQTTFQSSGFLGATHFGNLLFIFHAPLKLVLSTLDIYRCLFIDNQESKSLLESAQKVCSIARAHFDFASSTVDMATMITLLAAKSSSAIPILGLISNLFAAPVVVFNVAGKGLEIKKNLDKREKLAYKKEKREQWQSLGNKPETLFSIRDRYRVKLMKIEALEENGVVSHELTEKKMKINRRLKLGLQGLLEDKRAGIEQQNVAKLELKLKKVGEEITAPKVSRRKIRQLKKREEKLGKKKKIAEQVVAYLKNNEDKGAAFQTLLQQRAVTAQVKEKNSKTLVKKAAVSIVCDTIIFSILIAGIVTISIATFGAGLPLAVLLSLSLAIGAVSLTKFFVEKFAFKQEELPPLPSG